jgi:hypothetical protein
MFALVLVIAAVLALAARLLADIQQDRSIRPLRPNSHEIDLHTVRLARFI